MKSRSIIVTVFLLVAALAIGVGYAALSDELFISGTSEVLRETVNPVFDENVYFAENPTVVTTNAKNTCSRSATDPDRASFTANAMIKGGDKATFEFTIVNDNEIDAQVDLSIATGTYDAELFSITPEWQEYTADPSTPNRAVVPAGGSLKVRLTVELKTMPLFNTNNTTVSGIFNVTLNATGVEASV